LAEYRDLHESFRRAGTDLAAIAVDEPRRSEAVRQELGLPFPILCDTRRELISAWDLLNAREKGGIAKPAVFVIDRERRVRFASVDRDAVRVPGAAVLEFLLGGMTKTMPERGLRRLSIPLFADWFRALRNTFRFGLRSPKR
jgi:peroxiredoxin